MRDSRWPRGTWTAPGSLPCGDLLGLADVDEDRAVAELLVHLGGVDLVDLGLDLADELRAGRAQLGNS